MPIEEKVVRYTLTRKDLFAFNIHALLRNRTVQFSTAFIILIAIYFVYSTSNLPPPKGLPELPKPVKIIAGLTISILVIAAYFAALLLALTIGIMANKYKNLLCEHELRLTEEGTVSRSATAETARKWAGLLKLVNTRNYLYLYVNETTAQIVPKRCFASPAEAQAFEETIRERMKAVRL